MGPNPFLGVIYHWIGGFASATNFIPFRGSVQRGDHKIRLDSADIAIPESRGAATTDALALGVRPEHVFLADSAPLRGSVFGAEYLGTTQIVTIDLPQGRIKARLPSRTLVQPGELVGVGFKSESLVVFDDATGWAVPSALHGSAVHG